ncbi:MAG TPA: hypothetical protein VEW25_10575, partial [Allosphingosinicella sp.]|nr:hypothetical protein [Allosphingosinicella sp.]
MMLCLLIPTRNRPALAIEAARSALAEGGSQLRVLVSDNSASEEDVRALERDCRDTGDARLHYMRPPRELALPAHWDWALEQALARTDATHFSVQYDRKLWKPGGLSALWQACLFHPEILLSFQNDVVLPTGERFVCGQVPGTGRLYRLACERVVELTARGMIPEIGHTYPILSNCVVPRAIFDRIRAAFGDLCDSATPDAAFSYRFCALESRFHYWDRAPALVRAFGLSNARSCFSGISGGTWDDFVRLWGDKPYLEAAPIPGLNLGMNVCFHEYALVRSHAAGRHFPAIDRDGYLREISRALPYIEDAAHREKMRARLLEHGWREEVSPPSSPPWPGIARQLRRLAGRVLRSTGLRRPLPPADPTLASEAEAVAFLIDHPLPLLSHNPQIEIMEPVEVETDRSMWPEPWR